MKYLARLLAKSREPTPRHPTEPTEPARKPREISRDRTETPYETYETPTTPTSDPYAAAERAAIQHEAGPTSDEWPDTLTRLRARADADGVVRDMRGDLFNRLADMGRDGF